VTNSDRRHPIPPPPTADSEARDEDGPTPVHWAALAGDGPAVIATLLDADPKARDAGGGTPLHWAAFHGLGPTVVRALIARGADVEARDKDGKIPFDLIDWHSPLVGTDVHSELHEAQRSSDP